MDKTGNMKETEKRIEVMKAYLEGKAIQCRNKGKEDDYWKNVEHPDWNWIYVDYRVKPEGEPKELMTQRQICELLAKGYGEVMVDDEMETEVYPTYFYSKGFQDKPVADNVRIRPWGVDDWLVPTVDIYEEYVSKWNEAFNRTNETAQGETDTEPRPLDCGQSCDIKDYSDCGSVEPKIGEVFRYKGLTLRCEEGGCSKCFGCDIKDFPCCFFECVKATRADGKGVHFVDVSEKEKPTASEDSSSTVSKEESVGIHKRTPQEIADFFNCYVAMDEDGYWYLYNEEPIIGKDDFSWSTANCGTGDILSISESFLLLNAEEDHNWRTLYRPHREPIVMEGD